MCCESQVETEASSGLTPVSDVRQQQLQLSAAACVMRRGDVHTVLLPICPTKMWDVGIPVGRLKITWRRADVRKGAYGPRSHSSDSRANGFAQGDARDGQAEDGGEEEDSREASRRTCGEVSDD